MRIAAFIMLMCLSMPAHAQVPDSALVAKVLAAGRVKDQSYAEAVVLAATTTATSDFTVELLLGLSDVESDFEPTATSRLVDGSRHVGAWKSIRPPTGATGNFFCGITQAIAPTWKRCLELRSPKVAYAALVSELGQWLRRSGTIRGALQGHGCGNAGLKGACRAYAAKVLRQTRFFEGIKPTT